MIYIVIIEFKFNIYNIYITILLNELIGFFNLMLLDTYTICITSQIKYLASRIIPICVFL